MLVYRLCDKNEAFNILNNGIFDNIGSLGKVFSCNNHNYIRNAHYMHFFKDKMSVFYVGFQGDAYICTYDIPEEVLAKGRGTGKYRHPIDLKTFTILEEFAVRSDEIKFEYLKKIEELIAPASKKDVLTSGVVEDFKTPIYEDANEIKRT